MSWLNDLVAQHSEYEAPLNFWRWAALASISAVIKDQVWLPRYIYNLYPNIYVMLHAESGLKKGPPVSMASKLVSTVNNTKVIEGRSSIQGILKEMGTAHTIPGGKIVSNTTVFICSSELTSSIVNDPVAATILTDLYDRHYRVGEWTSLLKMESFKLNNPTVTMLTATNDAHSEDFFTKKDVQGGYFARTFIIYETEENRSNALIVPPRHIPDYKGMTTYLKELTKLKGEFKALGSRQKDEVYIEKYIERDTKEIAWLTRAGLVYQQWYDDFKAIVKEQLIRDDTGTLNRFGDSVLKVAMLLALAKEPKLEIDEESMTEAIQICEKLIGNIRMTTLGSKGMGSSALLKARIIKELLARDSHQITRAMLMKKMWMHYNGSDEFDDLMLSFDIAGVIKTQSIGNQILFIMEPKQVEEYKKFFEGKVR